MYSEDHTQCYEKCAYVDSSGMADHVFGLVHSPVCLLQDRARFTCTELQQAGRVVDKFACILAYLSMQKV